MILKKEGVRMDKSLGFWVGLTGGIASGKSTASDYLTMKGFVVIDADKIVSHLLASTEVIELIRLKISPEVVTPEGTIDRRKLGGLVFSNKNLIQTLNSIMHPRVRTITNEKKSSAFSKGHKIVFNDIPLLFESNLQDDYDQTVLIYCSKDEQLDRLMTRNSFSKKEALARINSQMDIDHKKEKANVVISNRGSIEEMYEQLDKYILTLGPIDNSSSF